MATIKDVAALAGFSTTTVSIVINGKAEEKKIPESTVEKIRKAMADLNYKPDQNARRLRTAAASKPVIGFFWPIDHRTNLLGTLVTALAKSLIENSFDAELRIESYSAEELYRHDESIKSGTYDGIIIGATGPSDIEYIESVTANTPIILLNRMSTRHHSIHVDNRMLGMQAASIVRKKGYTECSVIRNESGYMAMTERTKYFMEACEVLGISIQDDWIFTGTGTREGGAKAAEGYVKLTDRPKALFCEDDFMAQGALVTLKDNDIEIPRDLELLAFGMQSDENMDYLIPSITTVSLPYKRMVDTCINILKQSINGSYHGIENIAIEPEIMIRKSFTLEK